MAWPSPAQPPGRDLLRARHPPRSGVLGHTGWCWASGWRTRAAASIAGGSFELYGVDVRSSRTCPAHRSSWAPGREPFSGSAEEPGAQERWKVKPVPGRVHRSALCEGAISGASRRKNPPRFGAACLRSWSSNTRWRACSGPWIDPSSRADQGAGRARHRSSSRCSRPIRCEVYSALIGFIGSRRRFPRLSEQKRTSRWAAPSSRPTPRRR